MPGPVGQIRKVSLGRMFFVNRLVQPSLGMSFNYPSVLGFFFYHILLLPWSSDQVSSPALISFTFMSEGTSPVPLKVVGAKTCMLNMQRSIHLVTSLRNNAVSYNFLLQQLTGVYIRGEKSLVRNLLLFSPRITARGNLVYVYNCTNTISHAYNQALKSRTGGKYSQNSTLVLSGQ